ncbi:RHS repeat-associated core domain-containing protein [Burkholderia aenigmatica]|uniref:RHS repeat-associated core domain-containing protein n=1 Tax=Burkholderia aenigmatica TaxID=2015348 RepID=UPI002653617F|nr:RHS repeat-associated core domain-containing protein [Burkholderia aenigmatica]MDN7875177.1 RHS repeat-associated core domain-containing protein [Burkholderia aenigmatica]
MMDTTSNTASPARERQIAVVPVNQIQSTDVALSIKAFDDWLINISSRAISLERLRSAAGNVPVLGNILPLVDGLGDLVTLVQAQSRTTFDWATLGINLIGLAPVAGTAPARMSLRPALFLVREELRQSGGLGESAFNTLATHLNASIKGELDDFVQRTQAELPGFIEEAATLGQGLVLDLAAGLDALAVGTPVGSDVAGPASLTAAGDSWRDPTRVFANGYDAAVLFHKSAAKASLGKAAGPLSAQARGVLQSHIAALRRFAPELGVQIRRLADPALEQSIGWIIAQWQHSLAARGPGLGQSANVKLDTTSISNQARPGQPLEARGAECKAEQDPSDCKSGTCTGTGSNISFATGSESLTHTDFILPGPFPIAWTRSYRSSQAAYDSGELGARWTTVYTNRFDVVGERLCYHAADGRSHDYPLPKVGQHHEDRIEDITLVRVDDRTLVLCRGYERRETYRRNADRFLLVQIELRGGAGMLLGYDHRVGSRAVLSDLITYQDDPSQPHTRLGTLVDEAGRITGLWLMGEHEPQRRLSLYRYDEAGDLILAQDENTAAWTYQYQHHLITRYTDRTGRGMNLVWQGDGADARAVREWADDGSFDTRLEWDENIRLTYVIDAYGQETRHYYDGLGYTYRIVHPDQRSEWFFRDSAKNIVQHIDSAGHVNRFAHDENGNLLEHIRADGSVVHYAWDTQDQLIKISDAEGGLWLRDYDTRGRLTETIDPLGNKTEYAYNLMGLPIGITDANGKQKQLEYNANGQLTCYVDCSGKASTWTYDERGRLIQITDSGGNATTYGYEAGQLATIVQPDNIEHRFERDAEGRVLAYMDPQGRRTTWDYNDAGLLAYRISAAGQRLHYQWDKLGQLTALRNENGRETTFVYDPVGRLLAQTGFDGGTTRYVYDDASGMLAHAIDGQRIIAYTFDEMGRLIERRAALQTGDTIPREADWQVERFAYDGNGNLALAINADSRMQWFHDLAGNLVREHQHYSRLGKPLVAVWLHEYDALNQRIATVRPDGHRVSWLTYGSGHLLALQLDERELVSYERDDLHREVARLQGNGLLHTQQWDALSRLSEQVLARDTPAPTHAAGGNRLLVRRYRYDASGQLTDINDTRRGQLAYRYDPVGRLLEAQSRLGHETFDFDPASNRIDPAEQREAERERMPRIKTLDNLLKQYAGIHYQYDARGNLTRRWHNGKEGRFTWDLFDRLTHYEDERLKVDYTYDALGRRLSKHSQAHYEERREAGPHWNRAERVKRNRELQCGFTLYGWDGDTLAWESKIADEDGFGARTTHYVYAPGSFVPAAQSVRHEPISLLEQPRHGGYYRRDKDPLWSPPPPAPSIDSLAWYQCDHLGTPQELTDEHSEIAWSVEYCAWGVVQEAIRRASGRAPIANPIRFQGQYHDQETGLHYNRHRYYDPNSGRYITQDPIGLAGGLNVYQYALNPISWIDPLGLQTGPVLLGMGNLYRANAQPPLPALSRSTSIEGIYGDVSNLAFPSPVLPGEWVGVNVQWSMPTIKQYCAKGYFGDSPLGMTDNSGGQCRRQPDIKNQSIVPEGWSDRRKFTCTKWVPYDSSI